MPATPKLKHFHCHLTMDTLLLVVAMAQMAFIQRSINQNHREAVAGRETLLAMESHNEQMIMDHLKRTVARWEGFATDNPQLKIKQIPEPVQ